MSSQTMTLPARASSAQTSAPSSVAATTVITPGQPRGSGADRAR
ncbi:MAG: hypothetical protein R2715_22150 [Ilumatobacteraceae bacterium]